MPVTLRTITDYMQQIAPAQTAMPHDPVGLAVGDLDMPVHRILLALDLTRAAVQHAADTQCQLILLHHPPLYHAVHGLTANQPAALPVVACIQQGLAAFAAHTNLDCNPQLGTLHGLAGCLGAQLTQPLLPHHAGAPLGEGYLGRLPQPISSQAFLALFDNLPCKPAGLLYASLPSHIQTLAFWPGGGLDDQQLVAAKAAGADVLVFGETKLNVWREADAIGLGLVGLGHYESELPGLYSLYNALPLKAWQVQAEIFADMPYQA